MFYVLFVGFVLSMLVVLLVNSVGVYWIVIELIILVSIFMVGFECNVESMEVVWKYIIVVFFGISLVLFGMVLFYWGGSFVYGEIYMFSWLMLVVVVLYMLLVLLKMGFFFVLIGYGIKVGLVLMYMWLFDVYSEGLVLVLVMFFGVLFNIVMVGIV